MQLVPGVHRVDGTGSMSNVFLVEQPDALVLIDAGTNAAAGAVLRYLEKLGRDPRDLTAVLVTHGDVDHVGGLPKIEQETGALVVAHQLEVPIIEGREPRRPTQAHLLMRLLAPLTNLVMPRKPVAVDGTVADGEQVYGFRAVHAPGHSPGSTCYLLEEKRVLFAGDAMSNFGGTLSPPMKAYTTDMAQAHRSIKRIAELDFDVCCFGHGPSITENAKAAVQELAARL